MRDDLANLGLHVPQTYKRRTRAFQRLEVSLARIAICTCRWSVAYMSAVLPCVFVHVAVVSNFPRVLKCTSTVRWWRQLANITRACGGSSGVRVFCATFTARSFKEKNLAGTAVARASHVILFAPMEEFRKFPESHRNSIIFLRQVAHKFVELAILRIIPNALDFFHVHEYETCRQCRGSHV